MLVIELQEAKSREWKRNIEAWRASGQSKMGWCKANNLNPCRLRVWLKRLDADECSVAEAPVLGPAQWTSVSVERDVVSSDLRPLVVRVGLAEVEVHQGFYVGLLADVVKVLSASC